MNYIGIPRSSAILSPTAIGLYLLGRKCAQCPASKAAGSFNSSRTFTDARYVKSINSILGNVIQACNGMLSKSSIPSFFHLRTSSCEQLNKTLFVRDNFPIVTNAVQPSSSLSLLESRIATPTHCPHNNSWFRPPLVKSENIFNSKSAVLGVINIPVAGEKAGTRKFSDLENVSASRNSSSYVIALLLGHPRCRIDYPTQGQL